MYRTFQLLLIIISIASWQPSGSIDKLFEPSIAYRQLVDRSSFFIIFYVEMFLDKFLTATFVEANYARHLSTPLSIEIYWTTIYSFNAIRLSFCSKSLSIFPSFHLPKLSYLLQTSSLRFLQAFQVFLHLVSF